MNNRSSLLFIVPKRWAEAKATAKPRVLSQKETSDLGSGSQGSPERPQPFLLLTTLESEFPYQFLSLTSLIFIFILFHHHHHHLLQT
jgi:hypothetical protein